MTTVSKKILVVDDEKSLREIMKIMLVQIGYDPEFAENGEEAFKILNREHFPIILMDLRIPDIDGVELCMQIKQRNPESVIYAFSGSFTDDEFDQIEEMGFDGLLCKPVKFDVLKSAIKGAYEKINKRDI
jgi:CheY-like chemotaxis protein